MLQNSALRRSFHAALPIVLAITLVGLLFFAFSLIASSAGPVQFFSGQADQGASAVVARRLISIPFGIQDNLEIVYDGGGVVVAGHGECPANGSYFQLKSTVTQNGVRAKGRTVDACTSGGRTLWTLTAVTPDSHLLEAGPAEACAQAVIHNSAGGTDVYSWCKPVTLQ